MCFGDFSPLDFASQATFPYIPQASSCLRLCSLTERLQALSSPDVFSAVVQVKKNHLVLFVCHIGKTCKN